MARRTVLISSRNLLSLAACRRWCKQLVRLGFVVAMVVASSTAGGDHSMLVDGGTNAVAGDKASAGTQAQIGEAQPAGKPITLPVSACGETTAKFGSNDPNDPVDGTVNKTITEWLAAGNKADWKRSFGLDRPAVGDAESEIDASSYGKDLFLTGAEISSRHRSP